MASLTAKDRVSLCLFSFTDGRRCRTPRTGNHPHFCFYHAQKEAQACAAESLAKDLATFFSGDYLSACDLNTALARLIPAVIRGDIKPRLARTVAYMVQTQLQAIHIAQHEYINAFGTDGWRKAVRTSVNVNYDYRFPPAPGNAETKPQQPEAPQSRRIHPQPQAPAQSPARPATSTSSARPATSVSVGAGLARPDHTRQPHPLRANLSYLRPIPPRHNPPPPPEPVILSVAKDPASIPPRQQSMRPDSPQPLLSPLNPTTHRARNLRQAATPTPSTSTTTTASA
jgi:hypothetical protein